ncbi:substrate-binding domain-containing protein [Anatilimnocola sp. NA78]|uniref:substrate-binding domain-containing protein n=1 Tax=Anatilimnocola sp. NA78 TaxID=3415683 RepID=UPI003CE463F5
MPKTRRVAIMLDLRWPLKRHASIFAGTQRYADEQGWESIIDEYVAEHLLEQPKSVRLYDGVIGRVNAKLAGLRQRFDLPMVNTWFSSPVRSELPGVFHNPIAVGRLEAEHLLARGLRQFAVLTRKDQAQLQAAAAFRDVAAEAGFPCAIERLPLVPSRNHQSWQRTEKQIDAWMDHWQLPIGVSICTEMMGRLVVQLCHRRGWRVPSDVAILAGMNEESLCNHPRPSLSSVEIGYERIGYEAAHLLDHLMDERESRTRRSRQHGARPRDSVSQHILLPPQALIVRESTDFYAVEDELVARALQFIAANSHRDINCSEVAKSLHVHSRTLQRRFRRVVDWPIADEIRRVRIERAKRELTQSDRSIAKIAQDVGFGERMRLYEVFRREVGITPSSYRKQRRLENST